MFCGWYQVAYERDLDEEITPLAIGELSLILVRGQDRFRAADAVCPHRGANLGFGGRLSGDAVICPFHGMRIALGEREATPFCVREYPVLGYGGMIFVQIGAGRGDGLADHLEQLARDHIFVPGFERHVQCAPELVIENAFDASHFAPVHGVVGEPAFSVLDSDDVKGSFAAEGLLTFAPGAGTTRFVAHAHSPGIVITELAGPNTYVVITAATPTTGGGCMVRVSLAMPRPDHGLARFLLDHARDGIDADAMIWEHLSPHAPQRLIAADLPTAAFAEFCERFRE